MDHNSYLFEKFVTTHRHELEREAELYRLLASLPQQHRPVIQIVVRRLGTMLIDLGTWMKQVEPQEEPVML